MPFLADIRYVVPPLINLIVWVFIIPLAKHWAQDYPNFNGNIFVLGLLSLAIFILLVFLFISVKLPLTVGTLQWRAGQFSVPVTLSFLASIFFPSTLFWSAFLILLMHVIVSAWYEMAPQATTAPIIAHVTRQRPDQVHELEAIVLEGNSESSI
jgi:cation transport ATPase